jgi:metallophosphoesterase superfamily enzyme
MEKEFKTSHEILLHGQHFRLLPKEFRLNKITVQFKADDIVFAHRPVRLDAAYVLSGHIHPAVRISGVGRQKEYLPCFYFGKDYAVLPAFGSFTGQAAIYPEPGDRIFVLGGGEIVEWNGGNAR